MTRPRTGLLVLAFALSAGGALAQPGTVRGVVTDTTGRPLENVEILSVNAERSTRSGKDGRFTLARLPFGLQLIIARSPGFQPADQPITLRDDGAPPISFRLRRIVQLLDTLRIISHDGCTAYDLSGFDCRRRASIGQFRSLEEINALRPTYWADMFEGFPGLRRRPIPHPLIGRDWTVESTIGWRCLKEGWDGRERSVADQSPLPKDIVAIEYYDVYEKVPGPYKRLAWPTNQDKPCALVMYWTTRATDRRK